mgnify:CR=1 FL=1
MAMTGIFWVLGSALSAFVACPPIHPGQLHIHQDQRRLPLAGQRDPGFPSLRLQGGIASKLQDVTNQFEIPRIVFDDQNESIRHGQSLPQSAL